MDRADRDLSVTGYGRSVVARGGGGEELHLKGGMRIDTLADIDAIEVGIDALATTGSERALTDPHRVRADCRPTEHPVFAAPGKGPNLAFQMSGLNRNGGSGEKDFERRFSLQPIACRLAAGIRGSQHLRDHRLCEPRKEVLPQRFGHLSPMCELGLRGQSLLPDHCFLFIEGPHAFERLSH